MTEIKSCIDSELSNIKADFTINDIKIKAKKSRKVLLLRLSAACIAFFLLIFAVYPKSENTNNIFTISVAAASINEKPKLINEKKPVKICLQGETTYSVTNGDGVKLVDDYMYGYTTPKYLFNYFSCETKFVCNSDKNIESITYEIHGDNSVICKSTLEESKHKKTTNVTIPYDEQDETFLNIGFIVDNNGFPFTENDIAALKYHSKNYDNYEFQKQMAYMIKKQYNSMSLDVTVNLRSGEKYTKTLLLRYDVQIYNNSSSKATLGDLSAILEN